MVDRRRVHGRDPRRPRLPGQHQQPAEQDQEGYGRPEAGDGLGEGRVPGHQVLQHPEPESAREGERHGSEPTDDRRRGRHEQEQGEVVRRQPQQRGRQHTREARQPRRDHPGHRRQPVGADAAQLGQRTVVDGGPQVQPQPCVPHQHPQGHRHQRRHHPGDQLVGVDADAVGELPGPRRAGPHPRQPELVLRRLHRRARLRQ